MWIHFYSLWKIYVSFCGYEDDVVKAVFVRQQKTFRAYLDEISKSKLDLDSNSEAAVKAYYDIQAKIRGK